jgi:hypothetical protein
VTARDREPLRLTDGDRPGIVLDRATLEQWCGRLSDDDVRRLAVLLPHGDLPRELMRACQVCGLGE